MPVRVLDADGDGRRVDDRQGIRYAVNHHAQVINLSLEFDPSVNQGDIPDILSAIRYAHSRGVVVVAASGNEGVGSSPIPARAPAGDLGRRDHARPLPGRLLQRRLAAVAGRPGGGEDSTCMHRPQLPPGPRPPQRSSR